MAASEESKKKHGKGESVDKMKKGIKGITAIVIIAILFLQAVSCGVGQKSSDEKEAVSSAAHHLLEIWSDYLNMLDQMYGSALWAFGYVEAYLESSDWADLTKARTACIASARFLDGLSMTGEDLSEEEYLTLADAGIDTGYQTMAFSTASDILEETHREVRDIVLVNLEGDVFQESSIEILKQTVSLSKESISVMCRYYCNEANYLLLTLGEHVDAKASWKAMQESYPTLFAGDTEWLASEEEAEAAATKNLDAYEDTVLKHAKLTSKLEAALYDMVQMKENGDF